MFAHTIYTITRTTELTLAEGEPALTLSDGPAALSIRLPVGDDDALVVLDLLEASLDNLRSSVALRRRLRELAASPGETVVGWNGAGSDTEHGDMEANRG